MSIVNKYPYTDFHEMNLDYVLAMVMRLDSAMDEFKVLNSIRFEGEWNIERAYQAWNLVDTPNHVGYIAIKPVPIGINITNEDYWRQVANYSELYADFQNRVIALEDTTNDLSIKVDKLKYYKNKKIAIIGDSISDLALYPNSWAKYFAENVIRDGGIVDNFSLSGKTITTLPDETNNLSNTLSSITDAYDEIVVFLGVNDWYRQATLGLANVPSANTFSQALDAFASWSRANQPNAKINMVTPLKSYQEGFTGHKLLQFYVMSIYSFCIKNGWNIIDAHSYAPFLTYGANPTWSIDGIHPKAEYSPYLAEYIYESIKNKPNSTGLTYTMFLAIGDVGGLANRCFAKISTDGSIGYHIEGFAVSSGLTKLADLPEECQPITNVVGMAQNSIGAGITTVAKLLTYNDALYVSCSEAGEITGDIPNGRLKFIHTLLGSF